jgi:Domain of unknown function (DUF4190)
MDNPQTGSGPPAYGAYPPMRPTNGMAIAALVVGVVSMVSCPLIGAVAVYLGNRARNEIRRTGENGDSLALASVVVGWSALAIGVVVALLWVLLLVAFIGINVGHGAS